MSAALTRLAIAQVAHETNRAYCVAIGDHSQAEWALAPDWQKASAIAGVVGIASGAITKPEDSHANWMAQKVAEGWKYGEVKNADHKLHPCIVPYDELPEAQKVKDALFFAVVVVLLPKPAAAPAPIPQPDAAPAAPERKRKR